MTKKQQSMLQSYEYANNNGELWSVYGSFSRAKASAMDYCKSLQHKLDGYGGKICSHNGWIFTYGFKYDADDGAHLVYITPSYDYDFLID